MPTFPVSKRKNHPVIFDATPPKRGIEDADRDVGAPSGVPREKKVNKKLVK